MTRIKVLLPAVMLSFALAAHAQLVAPGTDNAPKVGDKAPEFTLQSGRTPVALKDFAGKKKVLLTFFPAAFTAG